MGRLTGCKTYQGVQYLNKTGRLVLSNEKLCFQWDGDGEEKCHHKSWKWPDLKDYKTGSDGKGLRKLLIRMATNQDTLTFTVQQAETMETLKIDLSWRMSNGNTRRRNRSQSPSRSRSPGEARSLTRQTSKDSSPTTTTTTTSAFKVVNNMILKPGLGVVQDYVVNPTNNLIVKPLDRNIVQPAKDEFQLASHKTDQIRGRITRSLTFGSEDDETNSLRRSVTPSDEQPAKTAKETFPRRLERMQEKLEDIIKSAPEEDQADMALMLKCWAESLASKSTTIVSPASTPRCAMKEEKKVDTI